MRFRGLLRAKHLKVLTLAAMLTTGGLASARADSIPYPGSRYNDTSYSFVAAQSGDVTAYFVGGGGASFSNDLGLLVNGVQVGGFGLNNHSSSIGDTFDFGPANAGDVLTFILRINGSDLIYSNPAMNASYDNPSVTGHNHIYSTTYTGGTFNGVPAGIYVAFEDQSFPGSDFNYNDESFVFGNVAIGAVPEPSTWAMMLLGFASVGLMAYRRRTQALSATAA